MDFIYSQLPEIVYNPADLTGISTNGTVDLKINNEERIIDANVLKVPGTLTIIDRNSKNTDGSWGKTYSYNGASSILVELPKVGDLKVESVQVTSENIAAIKEFVDCKIGDVGLKITSPSAPDQPTYIIIPTATSSSTSDIQKITSINTIYTSVYDLPQNASLGDVYPVIENGEIVLYEKINSSYIGKTSIHSGGVYIIVDTGLLAVANRDLLSFTILNGALNTLDAKKQDTLQFVDDNYDKDTNRATTESTVRDIVSNSVNEVKDSLEEAKTNLGSAISAVENKFDPKISNVESDLALQTNNLNNLISRMDSAQTSITTNQTNILNLSKDIDSNEAKINSLDSKVDKVDDRIDDLESDFNDLEGATIIKSIDYLGVNSEFPDKLDYLLTFKSGLSAKFQIDKAPQGEKGEQGIQGEQGPVGPGITGVSLLSSSNGESLYQILFDDPKVKTTTFIVKNGAKGADGKSITINGVLAGNPVQEQVGYTSTPLTFYFNDTTFSVNVLAKNGDQGVKGNQGEKGDRGDQGIQGPQGIQGIQGPKGDVGQPIQINYVVNVREELESIEPTPENGKFALVTNASDLAWGAELYVFSENENSFIQVANFKDFNFPNDLKVDENGKLRLISGTTPIGDGVDFPTISQNDVASFIDVSQNEDMVTLQLKNSNGNAIGTSTAFSVGTSEWGAIQNIPDYLSEGNIGIIGQNRQNIENLQSQINKLSNYHPIEINSFKLVNSSGNEIYYAKEDTIISGAALKWELNKVPSEIQLNGEVLSNSNLLNSSNGVYNLPDISSDAKWVLAVKDDKGVTTSKEINLDFRYPFYYGALNLDEVEESISTHLTETLQKPKSFIINLIGEEAYIYYLSKEDASFKVDGFKGGFKYMGNHPIKTSAVKTEEYYVYRSINKLKDVVLDVEII